MWAYPAQGRNYRANGAPIGVGGVPPDFVHSWRWCAPRLYCGCRVPERGSVGAKAANACRLRRSGAGRTTRRSLLIFILAFKIKTDFYISTMCFRMPLLLFQQQQKRSPPPAIIIDPSPAPTGPCGGCVQYTGVWLSQVYPVSCVVYLGWWSPVASTSATM